jgi:aminopeptidase-like protein
MYRLITAPVNGEEMISLMKKLWPLNRSITGQGLRETLSIIKELITGFEIHEVQSGTKVLDWSIPEEWEITEAYLEGPDGQRIADLDKNNLHILGYSTGVDKELSLDELMPHLHTLPEQPDLIPYVTSYYQKNWGFCITDKVKQQLKPGTYKAYINARHFEGSLTYGEFLLRGKSDKEVFISTYVCHPSMANNELSGPCVAVALAGWLLSQKNLKFTYRFVFAPETIGSAAYLDANMAHLKEKVIAAFNLTCVGDERIWSFMPSRLGNTYADRVARFALDHYTESYDNYNWNDRGSDERMYCSPLVNLPMVSVMRSKYHAYPEYHTSADNIGNVVTANGLEGTLELHKSIINIIENDCCPISLVYGEPQLGKRGLYPMMSKKGSTDAVKIRLNILSYCDGEHSMLDIAEKCNVQFQNLCEEINILLENKLIKIN